MQNSTEDKARQKYTEEALSTKALYNKVFSSEDGEKVLLDMIRSTGVMDPSIGLDPYQTYFNEGKKAIIYDIVRMVEFDPMKYKKLIEQKVQKEEETHGW